MKWKFRSAPSSGIKGQPQFWLLGLAGASITIVVAAFFASRFRLGPIDDAFISLRYAANWAGGHGLCFNPGEIVEGYSNFLLVLCETVLIRCGLDPMTAMSFLGLASLGCLSGLMTVFIERHIFRGKSLVALTAGIMASLNSVLLCWGLSGLESCLFAMLLLAGFMAVVADSTFIRVIVSAILLVLAAMTRLEAVVLFPISLVAVFLRERSWGQTTAHASAIFGGFGTYFLARALYFGYLFPNTFYAKLDYGNMALASRGALYLWTFVRSNLPLFLFAGIALVLVRKAPLWVRLFLATTGVLMATVIYTGGDHFPMFRFIAPVVPFLSLLALYPAKIVINRSRGRHFLTEFVIILSLLTLGSSSVMTATQNSPGGKSQFDRFVFECHLAREWGRMGQWFFSNTSPDDSLTTIAIGAIGYYSKLRIIDPYGIINPVIAHLSGELGRGYPGHEKYDVNTILAERPSYILLVNRLTTAPVPRNAVSRSVWGDFNQALSESPLLNERYQYQTVRLGQRFMSLFIRMDIPGIGSNDETHRPPP
jgi:hypothetical protein